MPTLLNIGGYISSACDCVLHLYIKLAVKMSPESVNTVCIPLKDEDAVDIQLRGYLPLYYYFKYNGSLRTASMRKFAERISVPFHEFIYIVSDDSILKLDDQYGQLSYVEELTAESEFLKISDY